MDDRGLTEQELSRILSNKNNGVRVSQSWVSRIINGQFRRLTNRTRAVFGYAKIPLRAELNEDPRGTKIIAAAVSETWDGTFQHAKVIAKIIRIVREFERHTVA